jgi:hypothetical protein
MVAPTSRPPILGEQAILNDLTRGVGVIVVPDLDLTVTMWERRASGWIERPVMGTAPPGRLYPALAYEPLRDRIVMFGGLIGISSQPIGETWEWTGTAWVMVQPPAGPSPRALGRMAYDTVGGGVLLFGGETVAGPHGDTWRWDGTTWTQIATPVAPSPRSGHAMCADPGRGVIVLHGGRNAATSLNDTWEWNGNAWRAAGAGPGPLVLETATFDAARNTVTLCGSVASTTVPGGPRWTSTATFDWNGSAWTAHAYSPPVAGLVGWPWSFGFDPASGHCLAIDPMSSTGGMHEMTSVRVPAAVTNAIGGGCTATNGVNVEIGAERLYLGESAPLYVSLNVAAAPAFAWIGLSNTSWRGTPLPFTLGGIGAPACSVGVAPDAVFYVGRIEGTMVWYWSVCNCPAVAGLDTYVQALMLVPQANPAGIVLTSGLRMRIGQR